MFVFVPEEIGYRAHNLRVEHDLPQQQRVQTEAEPEAAEQQGVLRERQRREDADRVAHHAQAGGHGRVLARVLLREIQQKLRDQGHHEERRRPDLEQGQEPLGRASPIEGEGRADALSRAA